MFGQGAKGLVKYAEGMGITLSEAQATNAVDNYRRAYSKVKDLWYACESAAVLAIQNPGNAFPAGSKIKFKATKKELAMQLPNNRRLYWQNPQYELVTTPWDKEVMGITVHSQNTYTRQWTRNQLIGSSIFQSAVQGTARDFLCEGLIRLEQAGYETINLVHDEYLLLADEDKAEQVLADVLDIVTKTPAWALDIPLTAEGWISKRYKK
jgi:DNA polymerase